MHLYFVTYKYVTVTSRCRGECKRVLDEEKV